MPKRYAKGKFAVGECARSGRKMLLKDMVSDGYYPSLVVDPAWYEGKHPQESLPEIEDPVALWRPAPERDLSGGTLRFRPGDGLFTGFAIRCLTIDAVDDIPAPAENASAYGSTEDELCNNPETTSSFRLDVFWKPDGTKVWTGRQDNDIKEYTVSPAWSCSPGDWTPVVTQSGFTDFRSVWWSPDGRFFSWTRRVGSTAFRTHVNDQILNPWSIVAFGAQTSGSHAPDAAGTPQDSIWSAGGTRLWIHFASVSSLLYEYTVTVPWDMTTLVTPAIRTFDPVPDTGIDIRSFAFSADGTVLFGMDGQFLVSWNLSTAFDITTTSNFQTGPTVVGGSLMLPKGLNYRGDNRDIFVSGDQATQRLAWFRQ